MSYCSVMDFESTLTFLPWDEYRSITQEVTFYFSIDFKSPSLVIAFIIENQCTKRIDTPRAS